MAERPQGSGLARGVQYVRTFISPRSSPLKTFFKSLQFRIVLPVVLFATVLGTGMYFFVLALVQDFVESDVDRDMKWTSQAIYNICDRSLQELLLAGAIEDDISVRINKAHTLGELEIFARQNEIGLLVYREGPFAVLLAHDFSGDPGDLQLSERPYGTVWPVELTGRVRYSYQADFDPWQWQFVLLRDAAAYASLEDAVTRSYIAIGVLFVSSILVVLLINLWVKKPLQTVVESLRRGELPQYRGVDEFEFLSGTISEMMVAIQEKNAWIDSLLATAGAMIVVTDADGTIVKVNKAFEHFTGRGEPQLLGTSYREILPVGGIAEAFENYLDNPPDEGEGAPFESETELADGTTVATLWNTTALRDEQDGIKWFIGAGIDISEHKRAARDRQRLEQQLLHAQKMEAVGTLAGGIAHEFNNLLQAISGRIQLMLYTRTSDDPDYQSLAEIDQTISRAAELVRRLLTFSRKMSVSLEPLDLNRVVLEALHILEQTLPKSIAIETELCGEAAFVMADRLQLEQVLINLATNARDAMEPDGGTLTIRTSRAVKQQGAANSGSEEASVILEVSDTGQGMEPDTAKHIFDPFFTTKEVGKGTGLGLSIVYGIISGLHGTIGCASTPGRGSVFTIELPAILSSCELTDQPGAERAVPDGSGTETVLLVDDESGVRNVVRDMLELQGYRVVGAASGEEALELFKARRSEINLVILDLGMSGMGGEHCLSLLKEQEPALPVIVASGYSSHRIRANPADFGAAAFVPKPFKFSDLIRTVREILDGSGS